VPAASIKLVGVPAVPKPERLGNISIMSCNSQSWLGTSASVVEVLIFAAHKPVDRMGYQRENSSRAASIRYVEASRPLGVSVMPQLHVKVADTAPDEPALTEYDKEHAVTYARLLDAEADNADWREVARIVLHIDPTTEPERARLAFDSHLARAKWVARHGYRHLLRDGWPNSET
jgi:hypothetical protein